MSTIYWTSLWKIYGIFNNVNKYIYHSTIFLTDTEMYFILQTWKFSFFLNINTITIHMNSTYT